MCHRYHVLVVILSPWLPLFLFVVLHMLAPSIDL